MTFNIWNYQRAWPQRRAIIAALIATHQPDVVGLQETRHDWRYARGKGQGEQLAELTGYVASWAVGQVYVPLLRVDEGLTVLTRATPERVMIRRLERFPRDREDENQRVCIGVVVDVNGKEVHVYDSHFSLSEQARVRNALEVFRFMRAESGDTPALLMGDLNARPHTLPIQFLLGQEAVDDESGDLIDCWESAHPGDPGFTYSSWAPDHRIDYVLGRSLPDAPRRAELIGGDPVNGVYASDHLGMVVEVDL